MVMGRPEWMRDAACIGRTDDFFPKLDEHRYPSRPTRRSTSWHIRRIGVLSKAQTICAQCPVYDQCAEYARHPEHTHGQGIWAGRWARDINETR